MDQPLRQPRTFWQWLTNQEGTLFVPPPAPLPPLPPVPRTALQYLDDELRRIHSQIEDLRCEDADHLSDKSGQALIARLDKLHDELTRRSKDETVPARQG